MKLPLLSQMSLPAALSILRGKKVAPQGIQIDQSFKDVQIKQVLLEKYVDFIGFNNNQPLTYLYILAQRAQLASMLHPQFTIAIPGLIHLENELERNNTIDFEAPFELVVKGRVAYKDAGALIPTFEVAFIQREQQVARCKSVYLARRKRKKPSKKQQLAAYSMEPDFKEDWVLPADMGRRYAQISGDWNPIHTSGWLAKLMGLKQPIIHGWYMVSRVCKEVELSRQKELNAISVQFKSPAYLPGTSIFEYVEQSDNLSFVVRNHKTGALCITGILG